MCNKVNTEFEIEVSNKRVIIIGDYLPLKDGRYTAIVKSIVPHDTSEKIAKIDDSSEKLEASSTNISPK